MDEGSPNPTSPIFLHAQRNLFSIIDPTNFSPIQNSNLPTPGVCLSAKESIQFHLPFHLKADGSLLWRNRINCENLLFSRFSISTAAPRQEAFLRGCLGTIFSCVRYPCSLKAQARWNQTRAAFVTEWMKRFHSSGIVGLSLCLPIAGGFHRIRLSSPPRRSLPTNDNWLLLMERFSCRIVWLGKCWCIFREKFSVQMPFRKVSWVLLSACC